MDFLTSLIDSLPEAMAAHAGSSVRACVARWICQTGRQKSADEVRAVLADLGGASETSVRSLVQQGSTRLPGLTGYSSRLTAQHAEELAGLLGNLTRWAQFLTAHGMPRSSHLRCQRLVEQLLSRVLPRRRSGEPLGDGPDWVLERFLGMGPLGEVWLAANHRSASLPRLACRIFTQSGAAGMLVREQKRLAATEQKLGRHPNIIKLLDIVVPEQKEPFLAYEFVPGASLEDWIVEDPDRRPDLRKHEIVADLASALALAHSEGTCHGDLKPANVLLTSPPDTRAKIADLGLGRIVSVVPTPAPVAATQAAAAPMAASPVAAGGPQGSRLASEVAPAGPFAARLARVHRPATPPLHWPTEVGDLLAERSPARDDVFALGVIWYQLLVERLERPPYDFADVLRAAGQDSHTIAMIARCLAGPERRFSDAVEMELEFAGAVPPEWPPVPKGCVDVSQIVREFLSPASA